MRMTFDQHQSLGEQLKQCREALQNPPLWGVGAVRETRSVIKALDRLKDRLDTVVWHDFPRTPDRDPTNVYYGMSNAWLAKEAARAQEAPK